jgi:hypothetical protein
MISQGEREREGERKRTGKRVSIVNDDKRDLVGNRRTFKPMNGPHAIEGRVVVALKPVMDRFGMRFQNLRNEVVADPFL